MGYHALKKSIPNDAPGECEGRLFSQLLYSSWLSCSSLSFCGSKDASPTPNWSNLQRLNFIVVHLAMAVRTKRDEIGFVVISQLAAFCQVVYFEICS
jgi:hypothetical protein